MPERPPLTARSRVAAVIGQPIRHSRSPILMNAAFAATGLDWRYVAFEVAPGDGAAAVDAMRTLGIAGMSVTMPHKVEVMAAVDRLSQEAEALGAVNCLAWEGEEIVGHNTDGVGLVASLRADQVSLAGARCVVLGAGGAARSVIHALGQAGAAEVGVVNRTRERAEIAAALAGAAGKVVAVGAAAEAEVLINATSVGMGASDADGDLPLDRGLLRAGQVVVDLVYQPLRTPLLAAAEAAGARPVDGLGMLVHQAAVAFTHWTGCEAPVAAMDTAARS